MYPNLNNERRRAMKKTKGFEDITKPEKKSNMIYATRRCEVLHGENL